MKTIDSRVKANVSAMNKVKKVMNVAKTKEEKVEKTTKKDPIVIAKKAVQEMKREILREETEKVLSSPKKRSIIPFIADDVKADEKETKEILLIPVKKVGNVEMKEKKEKTIVPKKEKGPSVVDVLTPFIEKGKNTKKELIAIGREKLPHLTESTISTMLTDSKNPKYNKFAKLTCVTEDGKIQFVK